LWLTTYVANGSVGGFGGDGAQGSAESPARVDNSAVDIIRTLLGLRAPPSLR
jgi:hypothetical protein